MLFGDVWWFVSIVIFGWDEVGEVVIVELFVDKVFFEIVINLS